MKRFATLTKLAALTAIAVIFVSQSFGAPYTVTMTAYASPGDYWANPNTDLGNIVLGNYASMTKSTRGFWTMCVETNEYFTSGNTYDAGITGTIAVGGGVGGVVNGGDPISVGTAYLYEQFALGNLNSLLMSQGLGTFNYDIAGGARVQNTIWALEDEISMSYADSNLLSLLGGAGLGSNIKADYAGSDVKVMNLTITGTANRAQDQLVLWQVPDGGSTIALLGMAFLAIAAFRRRLF